jgi:hypothetical protein
MSGPCNQCVHFRRVKPISQVFAGALDTNDAPVSDALAKIVEDERKRREAEAQYKTVASSLDRDYWEGRPLMSDFCGLKEQEGQYFIAEIKNAGGRCGDFTPGERPKHRCTDCLHRVVPEGRAEDQFMEQTATDIATGNIALGLPTSLPDALLSKHREAVPARIAFEASGAYSANGHLAMAPKYLDYCMQYSTDGDYAVCLLQNLYDTCPAWRPIEATPTTEEPTVTMQPTDGSTNVPGSGPPPLTPAILDDATAYIAWIFDIQLPNATLTLLRQTVIDGWNAPSEWEPWLQCADLYRQVMSADPGQRAHFRRSKQQSFVDNFRNATTNPLCQQIIAIYDKVHAGLPSDFEGTTTSELVEDIQRSQLQREAEAAEIDPALALQVRLMNRQANAQMLANIAKAHSEASMAFINNMKP